MSPTKKVKKVGEVLTGVLYEKKERRTNPLEILPSYS